MKYCFGVDVGGTTVKIGLFQADGVLVDKWEIKTYTENEGERILPDVAEAIKGKIAEKPVRPQRKEDGGQRNHPVCDYHFHPSVHNLKVSP